MCIAKLLEHLGCIALLSDNKYFMVEKYWKPSEWLNNCLSSQSIVGLTFESNATCMCDFLWNRNYPHRIWIVQVCHIF